jgi:7-carboxy-7-deazaguanine synthase
MNLKISEIFVGVQGEGCNVGTPMVFIRLFGCTMGCTFCDTKYSWNRNGYGKEEMVEMSVSQILDAVRKFDARWVCITGGEPLEQEISSLCSVLKGLGYKLALETNGSKSAYGLPLLFNWITVAPKKHYGGTWLRNADEFKFVASHKEHIEMAERVICKAVKWIQPCNSSEANIKLCADYILMHPRTTLRLGYQLHKLYQLK